MIKNLQGKDPRAFEQGLRNLVRKISELYRAHKYNGERLTDELPFHVLVRSLLRRSGHLSYFHCGGDPSGVAFREWIDLASRVATVDHGLKWFDWERYSSRQQTTMRMGGLLGRVTFAGNLAPFYPLLGAGEVIHAGKGTSFGLGRFRLLSRR